LSGTHGKLSGLESNEERKESDAWGGGKKDKPFSEDREGKQKKSRHGTKQTQKTETGTSEKEKTLCV